MTRVFTGGAFDLFHWGHLLFLEKAKSYGDYLIVHPNSDERIRAKKGPNRPIMPYDEREAILSALSIVDEVVPHPGPKYPVLELIEALRPDVVVLNGDEFSSFFREQVICNKVGARLEIIPRIISPSGLCTTKIVEKIQTSASE